MLRKFWSWLNRSREERISPETLRDALRREYATGVDDGVCWTWPIRKE